MRKIYSVCIENRANKEAFCSFLHANNIYFETSYINGSTWYFSVDCNNSELNLCNDFLESH